MANETGYFFELPEDANITVEYKGVMKGEDVPRYGVTRNKDYSQEKIEDDTWYACLLFTNNTTDRGLSVYTDVICVELEPFIEMSDDMVRTDRVKCESGHFLCPMRELSPQESIMYYIPIEKWRESDNVRIVGYISSVSTYMRPYRDGVYEERVDKYERIDLFGDFPLFLYAPPKSDTGEKAEFSFLLAGLREFDFIYMDDSEEEPEKTGIVVFYENNTDRIIETDVLVGDVDIYDSKFFMEYDILLKSGRKTLRANLRCDRGGADSRHPVVLMPGEKWKVPLPVRLKCGVSISPQDVQGVDSSQGLYLRFVEKMQIEVPSEKFSKRFKGTGRAVRFWDVVRWRYYHD